MVKVELFEFIKSKFQLFSFGSILLLCKFDHKVHVELFRNRYSQGGSGHGAIYYTSPQSSMIMFSYSLDK